LAPPLATWIAAHHGWRVAFLGTALAGLAWVPAWLAIAWSGRARAILDGPREPVAATPARGRLLRHPDVLPGPAGMLARPPALAFAASWGAKFLVSALHLTQTDVGRYLWLPPLLYDAGALAFGHLASRGSSTRALLAAAATLCSLGAIVTPFAGGPWR